jgi:hypothetical protein
LYYCVKYVYCCIIIYSVFIIVYNVYYCIIIYSTFIIIILLYAIINIIKFMFIIVLLCKIYLLLYTIINIIFCCVWLIQHCIFIQALPKQRINQMFKHVINNHALDKQRALKVEYYLPGYTFSIRVDKDKPFRSMIAVRIYLCCTNSIL